MERGEGWGRGVVGQVPGWHGVGAGLGLPTGTGLCSRGRLQAKRGQVCQVFQHHRMLPGRSLAGAQPGPQPLHTHPRGQVRGFLHSHLAGSQDQGKDFASQLLFPLELRRCSLILSAARHQHCLPTATGKGTNTRRVPGPRAGELGHSWDVGLTPTGRDTKPAEWEALGTADSCREGKVLGSPRRACSSQWLPPEGTQESRELRGIWMELWGFVRAGELSWL